MNHRASLDVGFPAADGAGAPPALGDRGVARPLVEDIERGAGPHDEASTAA